jgi:hypothetical protein
MELLSPEGKQTRIEAINKDVVHQICSGQVRTLHSESVFSDSIFTH